MSYIAYIEYILLAMLINYLAPSYRTVSSKALSARMRGEQERRPFGETCALVVCRIYGRLTRNNSIRPFRSVRSQPLTLTFLAAADVSSDDHGHSLVLERCFGLHLNRMLARCSVPVSPHVVRFTDSSPGHRMAYL